MTDARTEPATPIVIVVENPNENPSVYVIGDVEVIEVSSYPTTGHAASERDEYDTYPTDMRALAARVANLGPGGAHAAGALEAFAVRFEQAVAGDA